MHSLRCHFSAWDRILVTLLVMACMAAAMVIIGADQSVLAQTGLEPGDYQSAGSGIWNDASNWEIWNGDNWESASAWPGQDEGDDYTVTIQSGHVISDNNAGTLYFGDLIVYGHLELSSNLYLDGTSSVLVDGIGYDGSDIITGGSIRWLADVVFRLPPNAILNVINVKDTDETVIDGLGLYAPASPNNNKRLAIGIIDYAAANGGGNVVYTFADINGAGGVLEAIAKADNEELHYQGNDAKFTTVLTGEAAGLGSRTECTKFTWTGSGPDAFSFSYNGQNPGQVDVGYGAGIYTFKLTVTSIYRGFTYSTSQDTIVTVHKAELYITALDQSTVYDSESFTLDQTEISVDGLKGGDTVNGITLSSDGADIRAETGEYEITPSAATGDGLENYNIHYSKGILSVIQPTLTITALDQNKEYGDDTFSLDQTEFSIDGLQQGDRVTGVTLTSEGAAVTATVTSTPYAIVASDATGTGLENYHINYVDGNLTIVNPAGTTFEVSNLAITTLTDEIWDSFTFTRKTGQEVLITMDVTNTGVVSGTYHGILKVDGDEISQEDITLSGDITLEPGASGQLDFRLSDVPTDDYIVEIGGLNGEFHSDEWDNWWLYATSLLTAVFILYLIKRFGFDGDRLNWTLEEGKNE